VEKPNDFEIWYVRLEVGLKNHCDGHLRSSIHCAVSAYGVATEPVNEPEIETMLVI
jgi:hypothetical protein